MNRLHYDIEIIILQWILFLSSHDYYLLTTLGTYSVIFMNFMQNVLE